MLRSFQCRWKNRGAHRPQPIHRSFVAIVAGYREAGADQPLCQSRTEQASTDESELLQKSNLKLSCTTRAPRVDVNCPKFARLTRFSKPLRFVLLNAFCI